MSAVLGKSPSCWWLYNALLKEQHLNKEGIGNTMYWYMRWLSAALVLVWLSLRCRTVLSGRHERTAVPGMYFAGLRRADCRLCSVVFVVRRCCGCRGLVRAFTSRYARKQHVQKRKRGKRRGGKSPGIVSEKIVSPSAVRAESSLRGQRTAEGGSEGTDIIVRLFARSPVMHRHFRCDNQHY